MTRDATDGPEVEWSRLKAQELRALAARGAAAILPVASMEQHGPHLPVQTDACLGLEVARRAARLAWDDAPAVVAPVVWQGLSEHHMPFGGTLTLSHQTFRAVLMDLIESLRRQGFRRILLSNSHGGNITALNALVDEMGARRAEDLGAPALVAATYAVEAAEAFAPLLEDQDGVQHACEAETSMMLACAPDLVDAAILGEVGTPFPGRALGGGGAHRWRPFEHLTGDGALGVPARATAEKGEALLAAGAQSLAALLRDDAVWAAAGDRRGAATGGVPFADR